MLDGIEERRDEFLELVAGEFGRSVDVVHEGFDVERGFRVGGKDLFEFFAACRETEAGFGTGEDIDVVLCIKLFGKVGEESIVDVSAAEVGVIGGAFDGQLALGKGDDGDGETAMACVDKGNMTRGVWVWKVGLCDAVSESGSGGVVDDAEDVEICDGGGIDDGAALEIGVPAWDGDDDIGDVCFEFVGGDVTDLAEVGGDELGEGEDGLMAEISDLRVDEQSKSGEAKKKTSTPTEPATSTRAALRNFCSAEWTRGSSRDRPMRRLREPTVFLKLEVSWVFAGSPMARCLGPKAMREGVARLETSLVMMSTPRRRATPIWVRVSSAQTRQATTDLAVESAKINADDGHCPTHPTPAYKYNTGPASGIFVGTRDAVDGEGRSRVRRHVWHKPRARAAAEHQSRDCRRQKSALQACPQPSKSCRSLHRQSLSPAHCPAHCPLPAPHNALASAPAPSSLSPPSSLSQASSTPPRPAPPPSPAPHFWRLSSPPFLSPLPGRSRTGQGKGEGKGQLQRPPTSHHAAATTTTTIGRPIRRQTICSQRLVHQRL